MYLLLPERGEELKGLSDSKMCVLTTMQCNHLLLRDLTQIKIRDIQKNLNKNQKIQSQVVNERGNYYTEELSTKFSSELSNKQVVKENKMILISWF